MKNFIKVLVIGLLMSSCGEFEPVIYDPSSDQTGIGFTTAVTDIVVPQEGTTVTVSVQATNTTSNARSFDVAVDTESSNGSSADYTIGSITIPAGSFEGTLEVTFGNFDNLPDLVTNILVLNLDLPSGVAVVGSDSTTFRYVKEVVCNDLTLTLVEDNWAEERDWNITDSTGAIVVQCSDFGDCPTGISLDPATYTWNFTLPDGCYTFTITDSFGDGQSDGQIVGNYQLSCSIIVHAANEGNWGSEDVTDFCLNQ